jgi:bacterial/archaeal transporter family protein
MSTILLLILATILWGVWGIADKLALNHAHPFTVQWMYAIPYVLTLPVWYWLGSRAQPESNHSLPALGWAVFAGGASMLALVLLLSAMQSQPASLVVAFTSAYPFVTLFLAVLLRMERVSAQQVIGMTLILVGLVVLQWQKG